jgi:hypothetical protein
MDIKNVPDFHDLEISTRTVMVYSNLNLNFKQIFEKIAITYVDTPLTKKKKNVDKKKLKAPYGAIINVQHGNCFRGINLKKSKKHWCSPNCRLTKINSEDETETKINSIIESFDLIEGTDIYQTLYYCTNCEKYYTLKELKKIITFLNQVTIVMSLDNIILNIMMFKDNFKIAGCKSEKDAEEAVMIIWDYILKIEDGYTITKNHFDTYDPVFLFRLVMKNVDFKLGFFIDREELNKLMNRKEYNNIVFMSQCETTGHTNVNIKMYCQKPEDYTYDCLVIPKDDKPYFLELATNPYKFEKRKKDRITFIVFSSSEIILSGRYDSEMERTYNFFVETVFKYRNLIEEKIKKPNVDLISHLKK